MTLFQLDKHQANGQKSIFPVIFFNRTRDNVCNVADTLSNMHATHKNSQYGQTLRNQKNILVLGFFYAHRRKNWDSKFCGLGQKKIWSPAQWSILMLITNHHQLHMLDIKQSMIKNMDTGHSLLFLHTE